MAIITQFALDVALDALNRANETNMQKAAFVLGI